MSSDDESWWLSGCYFVLFAVVIYLLCHTADNYFSPVLAAICDLLDMPPEVAGVTFLAFGNGAPDVFSSLVALTSAKDKEAALLVGMGSLLGAAVITITAIVGGVIHVKPTAVPPLPFTRDVVFLLLAFIMVLISALMGNVSLWMAVAYIGMYGVYVGFVFKGPTSGRKMPSHSVGSSQDGLEVSGMGEYGSDGGADTALDGNAEEARWIPTTTQTDEESLTSRSSEATGGNARRQTQQPNGAPPRNAGPGGRGAADGRSDFSGRGHSVRDDHFAVEAGKGAEEGEEEDYLLGRGDGGGGRLRGRDGGAAERGRDVCSSVPGSTVSMFLEEDDSAASWLAHRRWGSNVWGQSWPSETWGHGATDGVGGAISEPLLSTSGTQNGSRNFPRNPLTGEEDPDAFSSNTSFTGRRFAHAWASLQWKQWRLRRRVRRQLGSSRSQVLEMPWYRRLLYTFELPFVLARNATIPPVEADSWSQHQAALGTALAPLLCVWAFGLWSITVWWIFTGGVVAVLVGVPAGVAVWLTTHKRRMPDARWYRLGLALVAFASCVAWVYKLADVAVALIEAVGDATGIPTSVLGLTLLAWGNSSGDLVTNLAVAKAGYPGMAIAGSYGGPLFNLLLGVGIPMVWSSARNYPVPSTFTLDAATVVTLWSGIVVLLVTLPAVALSGFRFPDKAPLVLVGGYVCYLVVAMVVTIA